METNNRSRMICKHVQDPELGYPRAETGLIVKLPKTRGGKFELHPIPDLDTHFQSFLHALALYNAQQEGDPWIKRRQERYEAQEALASSLL